MRRIFTSIICEGFFLGTLLTTQGFDAVGRRIGMKRLLMTTSEPFVRSLKMTEYFPLDDRPMNNATSSLSLVACLNLVLNWEATVGSTPWREQWNASGGVWTNSCSISFIQFLSTHTTVPKSTNWTSTFSFLTWVIFPRYQFSAYWTTQAIPICGLTIVFFCRSMKMNLKIRIHSTDDK